MPSITSQIRKLSPVITQGQKNNLKPIPWEMKIIEMKSPKWVVLVFLVIFPTPHKYQWTGRWETYETKHK